jgi:spoIIIJ-associated protein
LSEPEDRTEQSEDLQETVTEMTAEPDGAKAALCHLQKILSLSRLDVTAFIASATDSEVTLEMQGTDASLLIGRHGQTLDSLQYLLLVMTSSRSSAQHLRINVDVEGYRQRRIDTLTRYATSLASQAIETGEEAVLEPLNSLERRIVHTALIGNPYVETYSEGYGSDRHVVISPRKASSTPREDDGDPANL